MKANITVFDYIKDIIVTKKGGLPLDSYVPYLINRWLSFINPEVCVVINQTNSKCLLEDKQMHYNTMLALFPRMKSVPRINYIKKVKQEEAEEDKLTKAIAQNLEISTREVLLLRESSTN